MCTSSSASSGGGGFMGHVQTALANSILQSQGRLPGQFTPNPGLGIQVANTPIPNAAPPAPVGASAPAPARRSLSVPLVSVPGAGTGLNIPT